MVNSNSRLTKGRSFLTREFSAENLSESGPKRKNKRKRKVVLEPSFFRGYVQLRGCINVEKVIDLFSVLMLSRIMSTCLLPLFVEGN